MTRFLSFRRIFRTFLVLGFLSTVGILLTDHWISTSTSERLIGSAADVPRHEVALVLGCSEYLADGRLNLYFLYRVNAAAELYHAGKCDFLLVSGDNSREEYNEPDTMRRALINRGVPDDRIVSDFAGFRTLDSVVRAREVFQQDALIVISQKFHNERAIFIGEHHGIDLIGYNAQSVRRGAHAQTWLREKLARFKTALDLFVTGAEPKFLGEPVPIRHQS
ncbi:MAG: ElyC/SanA/YdcF family protein [Verrucomicrobiota bacterium]